MNEETKTQGFYLISVFISQKYDINEMRQKIIEALPEDTQVE